MRGIILIFFFTTFFIGFARFLLELPRKYRDTFLLKFSVLLMVVSGGMFFFLIWLEDMQTLYPNNFFLEYADAMLFLILAFFFGWAGLLWLRRLK